MERPISYRGEEAYIFISYAHKDSDRVWPIIDKMQSDGFRVWYDDGIDPGSEWDENIAAHVAGCGYFIAFLSDNYLASNNCKDELNFARDQGKPQLLIYLEDVELPQGMAMRIGRNQAIFEHRYANKQDFFAKLYEAQDINSFQSGYRAPAAEPKTEVVYRNSDTRKKKLWPFLLAALLVLTALGILFFGKKDPKKSPEGAQTEEKTKESSELEPVMNDVMVDNAQLKVTALKTTLDSQYYTLSLAVENKGQADLYLEYEDFYLNGVSCELNSGNVITTGKANLLDVMWKRSRLEDQGIDPEKITLIEAEFGGRYIDDSGEIEKCKGVYYPYGEENATILSYTPTETDVVLVDSEEYLVIARGSSYDENDYWNLELVCINRGSGKKYFATEEDCVNNYRMNPGLAEWVWAERMKYCNASFSKMQWASTDYEKVLHYSGKLYAQDEGDFASEPELLAFEYYPEGENVASVIAKRQLTADEILWENEYVRVAYLGSREYNNSKADLIYCCNLTDEYQEIGYNFTYASGDGEEYTGSEWALEAGQETIHFSYRNASAWDRGTPAKLFVGVWDRDGGSFREYTDEEVEFLLFDPAIN